MTDEQCKRCPSLEAENLRLRLGQVDRADAERLVAWLRAPARKSANLAFTAGPERQVAYAVEDALRDAAAARAEIVAAARELVDGGGWATGRTLDRLTAAFMKLETSTGEPAP